MKKVILISSIAVVLLLSAKAQAQTVCASGKKATLTVSKIHYLHSYNNDAINTALAGCVKFRLIYPYPTLLPVVKSDTIMNNGIVIKYNSTADLILALLEKQKRSIDTTLTYYYTKC